MFENFRKNEAIEQICRIPWNVRHRCLVSSATAPGGGTGADIVPIENIIGQWDLRTTWLLNCAFQTERFLKTTGGHAVIMGSTTPKKQHFFLIALKCQPRIGMTKNSVWRCTGVPLGRSVISDMPGKKQSRSELKKNKPLFSLEGGEKNDHKYICIISQDYDDAVILNKNKEMCQRNRSSILTLHGFGQRNKLDGI